MPFGIAAALLAVIALALPSFASADPLGSTEPCAEPACLFTEGLRSGAFIANDVTGPEGNVWFTDPSAIEGTSAIGKITPSGEITEYEYEEEEEGSELNAGTNLAGIAVGPEGKLWVTDWGSEPGIAVIDPASPETATEYSLPASSVPQGIVAGPGGNLWFADDSTTPKISAFSPTETEVVKECPIGNLNSHPQGIVVGSDGNLWFTDTGNPHAIGKANPSTCAVEEFATGEGEYPGGSPGVYGPWGIAAGADGNVWFTGAGEETSPAIGRITPSGVITEYGTGLPETSRPLGLTAAEGKLWFTDNAGVSEEQEIEFTGSWANGNEFELCNEAETQCGTGIYSTEVETLEANIQSALESIYGEGNIRAECPSFCVVVFRKAGQLVSTSVGQTSCAVKTGGGSCPTSTLTQGVPNAVGSITYSGGISLYPINGLRSVTQAAYSGGNVWFPIGLSSLSKIGKFGIETGPTNRRTLTLTKSPSPDAGTGTGTVTSKPKGVKCAANCSSAEASIYKNTLVVLKAKAATGSTLSGWSGCESETTISATEGTCTVTMSTDQAVEAQFGETSKPIAEAKALSFVKEGEGFGTVKSKPGGIGCEADCTATAALFQSGKVVVLTAVSAPGSEFAGWSGCDAEPAGNCEVTMSGPKAVTATFNALPKNPLTVAKSPSPDLGTGTGAVTSKPKAVNCPANCAEASASLPEDALVVLKGKASSGSTLSGWTGCESTTTISATEGTCTVSMATAHSVTAQFGGTSKAIAEAKALNLAKAGSGFGTVKSKPGGIACEAACESASALYLTGKVVVLTGTPAAGSQPVEWSGCDAEPAGNCEVTMSGVKNVTATFDELE